MHLKNPYLGNMICAGLNLLVDAISLLACMLVSQGVIQNTVIGGALFLAAQVWILFVRMFNSKSKALLPDRIKTKSLLVLVSVAALNVVLLVIYPYAVWHNEFGALVIYIVLLTLGRTVSELIAARSPRLRAGLVVATNLLFSICMMLYISGHLVADQAQQVVAFTLAAALLLSVRQVVEPKTRYRDEFVMDDEKVRAFKIYNRMSVSLSVALHIFILSFACYSCFNLQKGFWDSILEMTKWLIVVCMSTFFLRLFLRRKTMTKYDKPSMFVLGAGIWVATSLLMYRGVQIPGWVSVALWNVGLSLMVAVLFSMGEDMRTVISFGLGHRERGEYARLSGIMLEWSTIIAYIVMLALLTLSSFDFAKEVDMLEAALGVQNLFGIVMLVLPMIFIFGALIYALVQPLDKQYAEKLKIFREQEEQGAVSAALEQRLDEKLLKGTKRLGLRVICLLLGPFFPCKVQGEEKVDVSQGPVIFVCNHLELYGPIVCTLRLPFYHRPWVISNMLSRDLIEEHMREGVDRTFRFIPKRLRDWLRHVMSPLVLFIMRSVDPIPCYRTTARDVVKTIRASVEAMEYEDNILLFPENPRVEGENAQYKESGVSEFFTGFVKIGSEYYKKTGRCTTFYPIYIDKKKRILTFGEGITYQPENHHRDERTRIVEHLHDEMERMAE